MRRTRAPNAHGLRAWLGCGLLKNFDGQGAGFEFYFAGDLRPASLPPGRFSGNREALQAVASRVLRGARDARK